MVAARGLGGLTHRAVDAEAGLPEGTTSYYFRTRAALLVALGEFVATALDEDDDAMRVNFANIVAAGGRETALDFVAAELLACADERRDHFLARIEFTLAASRDPELAPVAAALTAASRRPIEFFLRLLTDGGEDLPVDLCAGVLDGVALSHATGQGPLMTVDEITEIVRSMLGHPDGSEWRSAT